MTSQFWGYAGADILAFVVILLLSLIALPCAWWFVRYY